MENLYEMEFYFTHVSIFHNLRETRSFSVYFCLHSSSHKSWSINEYRAVKKSSISNLGQFEKFYLFYYQGLGFVRLWQLIQRKSQCLLLQHEHRISTKPQPGRITVVQTHRNLNIQLLLGRSSCVILITHWKCTVICQASLSQNIKEDLMIFDYVMQVYSL